MTRLQVSARAGWFICGRDEVGKEEGGGGAKGEGVRGKKRSEGEREKAGLVSKKLQEKKEWQGTVGLPSKTLINALINTVLP